jgi:hypothetical protein
VHPSKANLPTIAVLLGGGSREDVSHRLEPLGALEWYDQSTALVERIAVGPLDAVVTTLEDERGRSIAKVVAEIAARRPTLPIVLHTRIDHHTVERVTAVFTLGLRMECAIRPHARVDSVVLRMLDADYRPGVAPLLLHHFMHRVPPSLRVFIAIAILEAAARRTVDELARWSRVSSRTIERRLRAAGWPAAHVVTQSFAALDAVWLMTEYGWSARRVRDARAFSHASGVTRLLTAYAGTRPATLIEDGGFAAALEHVSGRLLGG